jgi:hypothetical protein
MMMIMSNSSGGSGQTNFSQHPWLLNSQFKNSGKNIPAGLAPPQEDPNTTGKRYGLRRNLSDETVDSLGLTADEMALVQAELNKTEVSQPAAVSAELAKIQTLTPQRSSLTTGDAFESSTNNNAPTSTPETAQYAPTFESIPRATIPSYAYPPAVMNGSVGAGSATNTNTPESLSPEQAQALQQLLLSNGGGGGLSPAMAGATGVGAGVAGAKGLAQTVGTGALQGLQAVSDGSNNLLKSMVFGNPDITFMQGAGTVAAGFAIANAGGLAINKLHGYDWAGGMAMNDDGKQKIHDSVIGKFARVVDEAGNKIGIAKNAKQEAFGVGYLDDVQWMPDSVKRILGNNKAHDFEKTLADGSKTFTEGDIHRSMKEYMNHMFGKVEEISTNTGATYQFAGDKGMIGQNARIVGEFAPQFEAIITPERIHHISELKYNTADNEMMAHYTHKLLERVKEGGWGQGFFNEADNLPLANRNQLIEHLHTAYQDLASKGKTTLQPLSPEITPTVLASLPEGNLHPQLGQLFSEEVVAHAFEQHSASMNDIMGKPLQAVQKEMPAWVAEEGINKLKKDAYHLFGKDLGAQNPIGVVHDALSNLKTLERGIVPAENFLGHIGNFVKSTTSWIPFSNEFHGLFRDERGWDGQKSELLKQLDSKQIKALEVLYGGGDTGKAYVARMVNDLENAKDLYQFQDILRGMQDKGKIQLKAGKLAGELYDNVLGRIKQMCAEDFGPRTQVAKAVEHMEVKGLGRIVPTVSHWFKNVWVGNPFEHLSGMLETAHFSNQEGKTLQSLWKATFGGGMTRVSFMLGAMLVFTQAIGASFKEKNPKFTTMPTELPATATGTPPNSNGTVVANANTGVPTPNNASVFGNTMAMPTQFNGATPYPPMANAPRQAVTEVASPTGQTPPVAMPAQTVPANGTTVPAYKPNLLDMGRAFTREFVSAGLGFMVFMGLFNSVNAQTHLPMKLLGRFAPQTAKFPLPFLGPIRMNWLGAAINIGGGFLLMPVISNLLLKATDAIIGKPQYIKVEEATKKLEEAKHKQEELLKKQQKQQQGIAGLPAGFNPAGLTMPTQLPTPLQTTPEQYGVLGNMALNANRGRSGQ